MGRHEIRLRRQKMTSRRIESHKNYYEVLKRHERSIKTRKMVRLVLLLLAFILLISMVYFTAKLISPQNDDPSENEQVSITISRPGIIQYVSLNTTKNGKAKKPGKGPKE